MIEEFFEHHDGQPLLEVRDLRKYFPLRKGLFRHTVGDVRAVDGISFQIQCGETLGLVGMRPEYLRRFPHAFSGGQRQRIGMARALALNPRLIVADEPVSALDVSIQAQVLNLMTKLQQRLKLTYLFVSHDLTVIRHICDHVAVMYLGKIVEMGPTKRLFESPKHPYTEALLSAVPEPRARGALTVLEGEVPSPANPPPGCHFHLRCPYAVDQCRSQAPVKRAIASDRLVACHRADELTLKGIT